MVRCGIDMVKWSEARKGQVRLGMVWFTVIFDGIYANMVDVVNAWCGGLIAWLVQVRYGMVKYNNEV